MPLTRELLTQAEMRSLCDAAESARRRRTRKRAKVEPAKVAFT
jgi:hypothetical protein